MRSSFSITLSHISKRYGNRTVLDIGELHLESGHVYAMIGANGSGKSTLLRVMAGTSEATTGSMLYARTKDDSNQSERAEAPKAPSIGYMPQNSFVFGFTVYRNVAMALESFSSLSKEEVDKRTRHAIEAVGMSHMEQARGGRLSGGEAQRVAFARMIAAPHSILLLDEPTASMDIAGTLKVEQALHEYCAHTGCLTLIATHAPSQARRVADRAILLSSGHVAEFGDAQDVLDHPTSDEGREFLSYWKV